MLKYPRFIPLHNFKTMKPHRIAKAVFTILFDFALNNLKIKVMVSLKHKNLNFPISALKGTK